MPRGRSSSMASTCSSRRTRPASPSSGVHGANSVPVDRLRVAVVGVGHLGRHHARILSTLEGVELVAVVDTNSERAAAASATTGAPALTDFRDVLDASVDAVSIAVPTELHRDIALPFLQRGIAALVE